jgi:peroxiredoxin Q/BCP
MLVAIMSVVFTIMTGGVAAAAVSEGDPAPDFSLQDQGGKIHTLADYRGQWLVLYFYPKDDTPGCTTEACEFRDNIFAFKRLNSQIVGISLDDESSHKEFAEKYSLPFPLLADTGKSVATAYGVLGQMAAFKYAKRETFLIDPEGRIVRHYEKVDPKSHSAEVLTDLERLSANAP